MNEEQLHDYTEVVIELWAAYHHKSMVFVNVAGGASANNVAQAG